MIPPDALAWALLAYLGRKAADYCADVAMDLCDRDPALALGCVHVARGVLELAERAAELAREAAAAGR